VAVNKIDFAEQEDSALEFHALGLDPIVPVSAAHGFGLRNLRSLIWESLEQETEPPSDEAPPRVAVIGRPNAGKSSLINQLAGKLRQVVDDRPGTTRDAVDVELNLDGRKYVLVDTAGVRRKGRTSEKLEKLSVMRALRSLERADVAFLVIDALEGLADQDAHIAGYAHERGRPLALLLNKWDAVDDKLEARRNFQKSLELKMSFLEKTPWMTISALNGAGLHRLFPLVDRIMSQYVFRAPTAEVNKVVEAAVAAHAPPFAGRGRIKFFYSAQVSIRPPSFVIFANRPESVHFSYRRFLVNRLRDAFNLDLSPVKLHIRSRRETDKPESIPARVRARKTGKNKTVKSGVTGRKSATPRRGSRSAKTGRPGKTGGGRKS
jgi:GTP-binding protein